MYSESGHLENSFCFVLVAIWHACKAVAFGFVHRVTADILKCGKYIRRYAVDNLFDSICGIKGRKLQVSALIRLLFVPILISGLYNSCFAQTYTLKSKIYGGTFDGFADRLTIAAGDIDGDGDVDIIGGYAQGGLVYLRNPEAHLPVSPPSTTCVSGDEVAFEVSGYEGSVSWSFVQNSSSGTVNLATGDYVAGPLSGGFDIIEARNNDDIYGRAYVNVISPADVSAAGKAIVITGAKSLSDSLWLTTDYLGDLAFNTLRYRGYSKANLQYLSFGPNNDVDGNGVLDDIDGYSSLANVSIAINQWAQNAERLFIYMTDHGGDDSGAAYFRLNSGELLTAVQLDSWLDALQDAGNMNVTVVIDCCHAGSFLDELTYDGTAERVVLAACQGNESTYFLAGGLISFSDVFFSGIMQGFDISTAYQLAADAMSGYQSAAIDGDDGGLVAESVGASFIVGRDFPVIGQVSGNQTLAGESSALVWAGELTAAYPVKRVWCAIIPPGHEPDVDASQPVVDVPEIELSYNSALRRYESHIAGFTENGTYQVRFYAEDIWGGVSLPKQSVITQTGFEELAIILTGGQSLWTQWYAANNLCGSMYTTLRQRQFSTDAIQCFNIITGQDYDGDGFDDVDAQPSLSGLANSITNWAMGSRKLTLYIAGQNVSENLYINDSEVLGASDLDAWLDEYESGGGHATVLLEFDRSGQFISSLSPSEGASRVSVASTAANRANYWSANGMVSFSRFFLSHIFQGSTVGEAFADAFYAVRRYSRNRQVPVIDDDGDSIAAYNASDLSLETYIGTAFVTGDDVPFIGDAGPTGLVSRGSILLWAEDVGDVDGISNVWCYVSPPDFNGSNELERVALGWNEASSRYEAEWVNCTNLGSHVLTFVAEDNVGTISVPLLCDLFVTDEFEEDDVPLFAKGFEIGLEQEHNFDGSNDVDWVKFFALPEHSYSIDAVQLGTNSDLVLEIYMEQPDGSLQLVLDDFGEGTVNFGSQGAGDGEFTWLDGPQTGVYYVKVFSTNGWGDASSYTLKIWLEVGGGNLVVVAVDKLNPSQSPPGAVAVVDGGWTNVSFNGSTSVAIPGLPDGVHTVQVSVAAGYVPEQDPAAPLQMLNMSSVWYGNPKLCEVEGESWRFVVFQFYPQNQVEGRLVNRYTGEPVVGAGLAFDAVGGPLDGLTYNGYPNSAVYKSFWKTENDGSFPTNVWLPSAEWNLSATMENYSDLIIEPSVQEMPSGVSTNLGTLLISPLDANANGIADEWELYYGLTNATSSSNSDSDEFTDRQEYQSGTNPTNSLSYFQILEVLESAGYEPGLRWSGDGDRSYRVFWSDVLGLWPPEQSTLIEGAHEWYDTTDPRPVSRFYKIQIELPEP